MKSFIILFLFALCSCLDQNSYPDYLVMTKKPHAFSFPNSSKTDFKNPYRYIAHAGGAYNDYIYTDSLEALNSSADKGYVMFELDLMITSDNKIVAAHDWDAWKEMTGFTGEVPPSLKEFKSMPLFGELTPLTMADIVNWFSIHDSSILVTDKITDYSLLSKNFPYHERLMVETFTLEDYVLAFNEGIKYPLLSLDSAKRNDDGVYLENFIIKNKVPLAVVPADKKYLYDLQIGMINGNNGSVYSFTENDILYLADNTDLFGIYTDSIDFINTVFNY